MGTSVVYASIFSAVMAALPVVKTKLICYDTEVWIGPKSWPTPVEVLFGVQLGGGNDTTRRWPIATTGSSNRPRRIWS